VNGEGATPLMLAITSKSIETIQYLLSQRALVNERQNEGLTALHLAAIMDDANIVRLLRQHGADVNIVDNDGKKPVEFCRADNAALRKSFSENLVKKKPNDKEKQQSSNSNNNDDGDESESASYKSASSDDDQNEMNFENIIKLCATLRQTFDGVQNPDALRRMIAFYDAESTKLKRRLEELEKPKPNNENNNNNNDDDDDDDDGSEDSVENNDDGTPLLKLT
jgi:ankyrin repeat protein